MTDPRILVGNCLDRLKELADDSIDSIVTDPPYELSNDGKASPTRVALEMMFPKNTNIKTETPQRDNFAFLLSKIAGLRPSGDIPRPATTMPIGAVTFNDNSLAGDNKITDTDIPAIGATHRDTAHDINTETSEYLGCFYLKLGDIETAVDTLNRSGAGFISGGIRIGLAVPFSSLPGFMGGSSSVVVADEDVRLLDDAVSHLVGAGSGTTAVAATLEGFNWIGCEMTDDYLPIIEGRVAWAEAEAAKQSAVIESEQTELPL